MLVLGVHTSAPTLGLAVVKDGILLGETVVAVVHEHLENTAPAVVELLSALKMGFKSLDGFGVAVGPGSFSGTRVGLATVKGMAFALKKPVAGICSLEVTAYELLSQGELGLVTMDAKRGQVYTALYRRSQDDVETIDPPALQTPDEVLARMTRDSGAIVLLGDRGLPPPEPITDRLTRRGDIPAAVICALLAEKRLKAGRGDSIHALKPVYVRRPDAEEKLASPSKENS
jgi:tRNA threonylcarbamoyladenosine biosynthesis protein TsaB